jgi:hypothetical protein
MKMAEIKRPVFTQAQLDEMFMVGEGQSRAIDDAYKRIEEEIKPSNVKRFELLGAEKALLFAKKNKDYGNSFDKSLDEDGLLVAKIRMMDKMLRFAQLIKNPAEVTDEKIRDTLIDLSNYADMTIMWMDAKEEECTKECTREYINDSYHNNIGTLTRMLSFSGADLDGDTLKVFSNEELDQLEKARGEENGLR